MANRLRGDPPCHHLAPTAFGIRVRCQHFKNMNARDRVKQLRQAFKLGTLRAIGGSVYDARNHYVCCTTDLANVRHLISFERIDAGGSPTWTQSRRN